MCAFGWQKYGEFFNPPNFSHYFFNIYASLPHSFTFYLFRPLHSFTFYFLSFTFYLLPFTSCPPPAIPKHNLSILPLLCINLVTYVVLPLYRLFIIGGVVALLCNSISPLFSKAPKSIFSMVLGKFSSFKFAQP